LNLLPKGTHQYEKFIKPSELNQWSEQAGLQIKEIIGMHYNPVFKTYTLGPGPQVNYLAYARKHL
jgi:2-polyprenyl-6-hydroxyphenyl methylase/3-demethylubiquinone-9 3-methyltransferase